MLSGKIKRKVVKQTVFDIEIGYDKCLWSNFYRGQGLNQETA